MDILGYMYYYILGIFRNYEDMLGYPKKMTWWGWGFRFCGHMSGKHHNRLYKSKNGIAFEQETFWPTKSKHSTPLLLGPRALGGSAKIEILEIHLLYLSTKKDHCIL